MLGLSLAVGLLPWMSAFVITARYLIGIGLGRDKVDPEAKDDVSR